MTDGICNHCRYRKIKYFKGTKVSDCCKRYGNPRCFPKCLECVGFSRSLKSRLGLVKELGD